jgi:hypothetical protein
MINRQRRIVSDPEHRALHLQLLVERLVAAMESDDGALSGSAETELLLYGAGRADMVEMPVRMEEVTHTHWFAIGHDKAFETLQDLLRIIAWVDQRRIARARASDQAAVALKGTDDPFAFEHAGNLAWFAACKKQGRVGKMGTMQMPTRSREPRGSKERSIRGTRASGVFMYAALLFVGDSHSYQSFGRNLDALLRTAPHAQVASFASWGSSPLDWFDGWVTGHGLFAHVPDGTLVDTQTGTTPLFVDLLKRFHPTLTIVALGSNLYTAPADDVTANVQRMTDAIKADVISSACLWVGPPDMRARSGPEMIELYAELKAALGSDCRLLDSRAWTHYPDTGGDGIHYDYLGDAGLRQTEVWATKVFEASQETLARPAKN